MKLFQESDLCKTQYGFRAKSQTTHVVQKMLNYVNEHATRGQPILFIDLSKAFDCLQYDKLYGKMLYLGFAKTIDWFRSYLSNRTQVAEVNGQVSGQADMLLGVPQGSILGPILFLISVNDINRASTICEFTKFADDTSLLTSGTSLQEATSRMNSSSEEVDLWFKRNKFNLNPSKTRYMTFNAVW